MDDLRTSSEKKSDRWLASVVQAILLGLFVWTVRALLIPVILGALLALILHPLQRKLAPKLGRVGRYTPVLLTVGTVILFVIPFVLFALKAISTLSAFLAKDWTETFNRVQHFVSDVMSPIADRFHINMESLRGNAENLARTAAGGTASWLGNLARSLPSGIIDAFLFILSLYFFLRDGHSLTRWLLKLSPFPRDETEELFASIHDTVNGAILGMLVTAAVQGALTTIALFAFGVPGALPLGILATVLAVIPMIGTTPVTFGAPIYLFATGKIGAGIGMLIAAVLIGLADNVIRPWVQSSKTTMHPLLVLLAIFGGLEAFGAPGIFIGPVIAAMALWIVDTYAELRIKHVRRQEPPGSSLQPSGGPTTAPTTAPTSAGPAIPEPRPSGAA